MLANRVQTWRDRLLDLSLRNRQLNYLFNKSVIKLRPCELAQRPHSLLSALLEGDGLPLIHQDDEPEGHRVALKAAHSPERLASTYTKLYRSSERLVEERGYRALYLSVGFIEWYEAPSSERARFAPLLMIPVKLKRALGAGASRQISLADDDDDPVGLNVAMLRKFESDFGLQLPSRLFEPVAETDERFVIKAKREGDEAVAVDEETSENPRLVDSIERYQARVEKLLKTRARQLPRWRLHRELWGLSQLDFSKGVMWRDLSELSLEGASPALQQLLSGGGGEPPGCELTPLSELDLPATAQRPQLLPVLPFDPSQQQAILAAAQGGSFVLQGPPGTGKSQTITQMIAQLIARGERVLFVSEKRAALEVVARRLTQLKLGTFVLNAHSHKSNKRALIDELWRPMILKSELRQRGELDAHKMSTASSAYLRDLQALQSLKDSLNQYTSVMSQASPWAGHRELPQTSLETLEALVALRPLLQDEQLAQLADALNHELKSQPHQRALGLLINPTLSLDELEARYAEVRGSLRVWSACRHESWSPDLQDQLKRSLNTVTQLSQAISSQWAARQLPQLSMSQAPTLLTYLEALGLGEEPLPQALFEEAHQGRFEPYELERCCELLEELQRLSPSLKARWRAELWLHPELVLLRGAFVKWAEAWGPLRWLALFFKRRSLSRLLLTQEPLDDLKLRDELIAVTRQRELEAELKALEPRVAPRLAALWRGQESDVKRLREMLKRTQRLSEAHQALQSLNQGAALAQSIKGLSGSQPKFTLGLTLALKRWLSEHQKLTEQGSFVWSQAQQAYGAPEWARWYAAASSSSASLKGLCVLNRSLRHLGELGWHTLVKALRSGVIHPDTIKPLVKLVTFKRSWAELCRQHPLLAQFSPSAREREIEALQSLDQSIFERSQDEISRRLLAPLPELSTVKSRRTTRALLSRADRVEAGLSTLKREHEKKSRHKPLRALFQSSAEAITCLKPCVCMSPLSVAHYLPLPEEGAPPLFDVVIFDEASQLRPWDAIGAVARAQRAIIVGDSKQLPPTQFFQSAALYDEDEEREDEEHIEDLESILDEAVASRFKELSLRWHYRSRHESLIAFSNHSYYENRLQIFPSATLAHERLGVRLIKVDGVYDRGKSRTNRAEAERVVEELFKLLKSPEQLTIGVVTFSQAQQSLIEDLIDQERLNQPELEPYFSADHPEPVFVKNLETVQGDERDVILFSVCYGPDREGRVRYHFGPLNLVGGERRLNVAVTRSRRAMWVVSSLSYDQLNPQKLNSIGSQHLRRFLHYAELGAVALSAAEELHPEASPESPLEEEVLDFLRRQGWEVVPQVGVAGYRVDLGVIDPKRPGRFLLGVECDGASYHSSRVARERDVLRQQVLEGLGWTIHRIWSADWWTDPRPQMQALLDRLKQLSEA